MPPPDASAVPVENRRRHPRRRMLKTAQIRLGSTYALPCIVLDISDGGAKLQSRSAAACPNEFDVEIGGGPARPCRVAWRHSELLGVAFRDQADGGAAPLAPARSADERRAHKRVPMLRGAAIVFNGGFASVRCTILDLSSGGARLKPVDPASCPKNFTLRIDDGPVHACEMVWSGRGLLGVRFLAAS